MMHTHLALFRLDQGWVGWGAFYLRQISAVLKHVYAVFQEAQCQLITRLPYCPPTCTPPQPS
jgi:hypothetical protein